MATIIGLGKQVNILYYKMCKIKLCVIVKSRRIF